MEIFGLTPRQTEIALLAARGYRANEIGEHLGISSKTVDVHLIAIHKRLDIRSGVRSIMLVRMALQKGWIKLWEIKA